MQSEMYESSESAYAKSPSVMLVKTSVEGRDMKVGGCCCCGRGVCDCLCVGMMAPLMEETAGCNSSGNLV